MTSGAGAAELALSAAFRDEWGRVVAALIRRTGDWDLAEECAQQAFEQAARRWPEDGVPIKPGAWLTTVAGNAAIDRIRRVKRGNELLEQLGRDPTIGDSTAGDAAATDARSAPLSIGYGGRNFIGVSRSAEEEAMNDLLSDEPEIEDDRLRLIFTCCHPSLALEARVALTLRAVAGLTTAEIAKAFLVPEPTMGKRITRAKAKIAGAKIPYRVPPASQLPERLSGVLAVLYLLFNEGYLASSGDDLIRRDLTAEAVRLTRMVIALMPDEPEAKGLLALMLFSDSRRETRVDDSGDLVTLEDQDRSHWDRAQIEQATALLSDARIAGPYVLQAAIAACHANAPTAETTDWSQIRALYEILLRINDTPVVRLNHAVAVALCGDSDNALAILDQLEMLQEHHLLHATRADLLRRRALTEHADSAISTRQAAENAYERALELAPSEPERRYLRRRLEQLRSGLQ